MSGLGAGPLIDLHTHILPGVDDGPATIEGSVEIARQAAADGVRVIAATPHVRADYPTDPGTMERLVVDVRDAIQAEAIPVDVRTGGEIAIDWLDRLTEDDLIRFGLGGSPHYVLLEFPYAGWPLSLREWVFRLVTRDMVPVIAHPERNAEVQEDPEELRSLVDAGALIQVTAAALDGRAGRSSQATAFELIRRGLVHLLASDAHAANVREGGLVGALEALGDRALARYLTWDVPLAIITDAPLPRPPRPRRRRLFRR